jgi:hypothetical protein
MIPNFMACGVKEDASGREGDSSLWERSVKGGLRCARDSIRGGREAKLDHFPVEVVSTLGEDIAVIPVGNEAELLGSRCSGVEAAGVFDGDDLVELAVDKKNRAGRTLDSVKG